MNRLPLVRFFVPISPGQMGSLPSTIEHYWSWMSSQDRIESWGPFSWTLQTYLYLSRDGFPCELTQAMPDEGIVIAHRDFLPDDLRPGTELLVVCLLADREQPDFVGHHRYAQFHVVQNPRDPKLVTPSEMWPASYMPYWPQPDLIPRDPYRGDRFETAAFFGYVHNMAPELRNEAWPSRLDELGLRWLVPHRSRWHDYSAVDVVIAVREFGGTDDFLYKPPSKLHNAWRAGVPAILGREGAYRACRLGEADYIEVTSVDGALAALLELKVRPEVRRSMVRNGLTRVQEFQPALLVQRWRELIECELSVSYERWRSASGEARAQFVAGRAAWPGTGVGRDQLDPSAVSKSPTTAPAASKW